MKGMGSDERETRSSEGERYEKKREAMGESKVR
jgi:hypothetical protein